MNLQLFSENINDYLVEDETIDYYNEIIIFLSEQLSKKADSELEYIKVAYEYVRDDISHSSDINADIVTCTASEVLIAKHGICFAKSHLLAALLRYKSIPVGFCYQKLVLDDEVAPVLIYHDIMVLMVYISKSIKNGYALMQGETKKMLMHNFL